MSERLIKAVREYLDYYDPADGFDGNEPRQKLSEILAKEESDTCQGECGMDHPTSLDRLLTDLRHAFILQRDAANAEFYKQPESLKTWPLAQVRAYEKAIQLVNYYGAKASR